MTIAYVLTTGPYDSCFIGPFDCMRHAIEFARQRKNDEPNFDFWAMSEAAMSRNIAIYGPLPVQMAPEDFYYESDEL